MASSLFSCDLVVEAKKHVAFLRRLHRLNVTLVSPVTPAVHRYTDRWLPLLAKDAAVPSCWIPPPDVAWLWHCHRLAPAHYEAYCVQRFGRVLEPNPAFAVQEEDDEGAGSENKASSRTRIAWRSAYPDEPFFLTPSTTSSSSSSNNNCCTQTQQDHPISSQGADLDGFDLVASCACQANFLWQVSGPRFQEDAFLHEGVDNYAKFLQLENGSGLPLVPTYQIDLMWHTHILHSCHDYHADCLRIRGKKFHHDDSLNDRSPGAPLEQAFRATAALWKQQAAVNNDNNGGDYVVPGGMYRGEPASVYYDTDLWTPELGYDAGDRVTAVTVAAGSSSSGTDHHVATTWEFLDDHGGWTPYETAHQTVLEDAYQVFLARSKVQVKSGNWAYEVDVKGMVQKNVEHHGGKQRDVRRREDGETVTWEFHGDTGWTPYSFAHNTALEDAYQRTVAKQQDSTQKVQVQSSNWTYEVNFAAMVQKNIQHPAARTRKVQRRVTAAAAAAGKDLPAYSSSSMPTAPVAPAAQPTQPWSVPGLSPTAFYPAAPKSTVRNVNRNLQMDNYVFGRGAMGDGYYSLETRDAYQILYLRLKKRESHARSQFETFDCVNCLCLGCKPSSSQVRAKQELEDKWHELQHMAAFVKAKSEGPGPASNPDSAAVTRHLGTSAPPPTTTTTTANRTNNDTAAGYYAGAGFFYYDTPYICAAGGCGGGDGGCGAGCGGGACGGGACGGGGCGGGGCGGGG